jgi:hypothetical protein
MVKKLPMHNMDTHTPMVKKVGPTPICLRKIINLQQLHNTLSHGGEPHTLGPTPM